VNWIIKHLFVVFIIMAYPWAAIASIEIGDKAPNFTLLDQDNVKHQLSDYKNSWVILYFYPKDDTPGCTTQACDFRDAVKRIIASKSNVFGVSLDSVQSHKQFAEKYSLPFSLLSDEGGLVAKSYDSLNNFVGFKSAKRNTFIIDPEGKIAKIYLSVKPSTHSQMVLNDLNQLQN
jgi:peroxiredoxin Q/BCP|tara:strand:- start:761 stop:1285 length:525 start_codon:yes stop_codon:yes gene_type:complete